MNEQQKIIDKSFASLRRRVLHYIRDTNSALLDKNVEVSTMRQSRIQALLSALDAIESERVYLMIELD